MENKTWQTFGFKSTKSYYKKRPNMNLVLMSSNIEERLITPCLAFAKKISIIRIQTIQNIWECCECSDQFESRSKCTIAYAIWWFINCYFINTQPLIKKKIDHIWTNAPTQQCHLGFTQGYWLEHKYVNIAFKLPNYVPCFIITPTN
jgi:hypothetical protein